MLKQTFEQFGIQVAAGFKEKDLECVPYSNGDKEFDFYVSPLKRTQCPNCQLERRKFVQAFAVERDGILRVIRMEKPACHDCYVFFIKDDLYKNIAELSAHAKGEKLI